MKQIIKQVISVICICSFATTFGQTSDEIEIIKQETNVEYLKRLSTEFENQYRSDKRRALEMRWPEKVVLPSGKTLHLQGMLDAETPLYYTTTNREAGITTRANKLYSGGGLGLSVHGENMTAGVWDGGAIRESHESFESRAIQMDGAVEPTMLTNGYDHATHVTGTVIASDQFKNGNVRGMAYKGNVFAYDWSGDNGEMADAASEGLLVSNHSYGLITFFGNGTPLPNYHFGKYTNSSAKWDEIMYNAPFYQIVKSAGNDRNEDQDHGFHPQTLNKGGYDLLKTESVSKNVLVVAATKPVSEYIAPSSVSITDFSSWGATDDGRIKPDIAAQGFSLYSSSANDDDTYTNKSGTSMAAPSVTGTLLLLQQHYMNTYNAFMKSATLRALTIHSADEAGDNFGPDYKFGWGLMNASRAAEIISNHDGRNLIRESTLENGATDIIRILPDQIQYWGGGYIKVTLAWTDPKGTPVPGNIEDDTTPMLVNDLDLRIIKGTLVSYPWKLGGLSNPSAAATKGDNRVDNVERNEFLVPPSWVGEELIIQISHKGSLQNNHQDYSLIISGIKNECPENLFISTPVTTNDVDLRNASVKIEANNFIAANGLAIYHAGHTVKLTSGFKADAGAKFKAYIEGCSNIFKNKSVKPKERKVVTYDIKRSDDLEIEKGDIRLYPNTTNGLTTLYLDSFDKNNPNYDVEVYTLAGRKMKSFKMTQQTAQFDISDLSSGLYLVKVTNGNTMYTKKLIKE